MIENNSQEEAQEPPFVYWYVGEGNPMRNLSRTGRSIAWLMIRDMGPGNVLAIPGQREIEYCDELKITIRTFKTNIKKMIEAGAIERAKGDVFRVSPKCAIHPCS